MIGQENKKLRIMVKNSNDSIIGISLSGKTLLTGKVEKQ